MGIQLFLLQTKVNYNYPINSSIKIVLLYKKLMPKHKSSWLIFSSILIITVSCRFVNTTQSTPNPPFPSTSSPSKITELSTTNEIHEPAATSPSVTEIIQSQQTPELNDLEIFYLKNSDLFLWTSQISSQKITNIGAVINFQISSDGTLIALERLVNEQFIELWILNLKSDEVYQLLSIQDFADLGFDSKEANAISFIPHTIQWIPNTNTIAFNIMQILDGPGNYLLNGLRWVDAETKEFGTLLFPDYGGEFAYSPDGTKVALTTPTQVNIVKADGSDWKNLLQFEQINTYSEYQYYPKPLWDENSSQFMTVIPPKDPLSPDNVPTNLWLLNVNGDQPQLVAQFPAVPFFLGEVAISPNLNYAAYIHPTGEPVENLMELHISETSNTNDILYQTAPMIQFFGWSKDSSHFAYKTNDNEEAWLGMIGEQPAPLTKESIGIQDVYWLDNTRFLFLKEESQRFNLYLADVNGNLLKIDEYLTPPLITFSKVK